MTIQRRFLETIVLPLELFSLIYDKTRGLKVYLSGCGRFLLAARGRLMHRERHNWLGNIKAMCEIANLEMAVRFRPQPLF